MSEKKREKKDIWFYAALLFTSAFVVILLTAYSQIKLNKSIDEYESKIQSEIKEKYVYQYDLRMALQENKQLKENIESLNKKIDELEKEKSELSEKLEKEGGKLQDAINFYNILTAAEQEYQKGNLVKCAQLLHVQIDKNILGPVAKAKYDTLFANSNFKAGLQLYNEGYRLYRQRKFAEAAGKFLSSYELTQSDYFSDDCLYFAAYSFYYIGERNKANEYLQILIKKYPQSTYRNEALNLQKKLNIK